MARKELFNAIESAEFAPKFVSNSHAVLKASGARRGLVSLYDSNNWEFPSWNRSSERSWKAARKVQYKAA